VLGLLDGEEALELVFSGWWRPSGLSEKSVPRGPPVWPERLPNWNEGPDSGASSSAFFPNDQDSACAVDCANCVRDGEEIIATVFREK